MNHILSKFSSSFEAKLMSKEGGKSVKQTIRQRFSSLKKKYDEEEKGKIENIILFF